MEEEVADHHAGGLALVYSGGDVDGETPAVSRARLGGERARGPLHHHLVASEALDLQGGAHLDARHLNLARGFRVRGGELDDVVVRRDEVARHAISNAHETVGGGADVLRDRTPPTPAPASSVRDRHVERLAGVLRPERCGESHLRTLLEHVPGLWGRDSHDDRGAEMPPDEGDVARPLARRDVNFELGERRWPVKTAPRARRRERRIKADERCDKSSDITRQASPPIHVPHFASAPGAGRARWRSSRARRARRARFGWLPERCARSPTPVSSPTASARVSAAR